jgi:hypothetical protein
VSAVHCHATCCQAQLSMSVGCATLAQVELFGSDFDRVPAENLRVSRHEFALVWYHAERQHDVKVRGRIQDWYGAGVVVTCRWLGCATVRSESGPWTMAYSPINHRYESALPEKIEAEALAADLLDMRRPVPRWLAGQPGWSRAICVTFEWAWRGSGIRPIVVVEPVAAS